MKKPKQLLVQVVNQEPEYNIQLRTYMMRILPILISLAGLFLLNSCSQKAFQTGYVVTNDQDTLYGKVADRNVEANPAMLPKVILKPNKGGKRKFTPEEAQAYRMGGVDFHSVTLELAPTKLSKLTQPSVTQQFLRVVEPGFVTLYAQDFVDFEGPYYDEVDYLKREDQMTFQRINMIAYRRQVRKVFFDNPEIIAEIKAGKWRYRRVVELVRTYNEAR